MFFTSLYRCYIVKLQIKRLSLAAGRQRSSYVLLIGKYYTHEALTIAFVEVISYLATLKYRVEKEGRVMYELKTRSI